MLGPVEPDAWIDDEAATLAIATTDATRVRSILRETDTGFVDPREDDDVLPLRCPHAPRSSTAPGRMNGLRAALVVRTNDEGRMAARGRESSGRWANDVWRFDDETRTWSMLPTDRDTPLRIVEAATLRPWDATLYAIERPARFGTTSLVADQHYDRRAHGCCSLARLHQRALGSLSHRQHAGLGAS